MDAIDFLQSYPSNWALGGAALCASGAVEMALRVFKDVQEQNADNLSKDLAGALFYGLCAANIVPYTAFLGGAIFTLRTIATYEDKDAYFTMKHYGKVLEAIYDWAIEPLCSHVVRPLSEYAWEHIISPLARTISNCFAAIFRVVKLPENPAWYGVAALIATIAAYKLLPNCGISFQCPIKFGK
jgi:hypothetical protein